MKDNEKKRFHEMAEGDKQRYEKEMSSYIPPKGEGKRKRRAKDPSAPKRALSGFFWFCQDERPRVKEINPDLTVGEVAKELGKRWNEVTQDIKQKYQALADKDKARYEKEIAAWKSKKGKGGGGAPVVVQQPKPEEDDDDDDEEEEEDSDD